MMAAAVLLAQYYSNPQPETDWWAIAIRTVIVIVVFVIALAILSTTFRFVSEFERLVIFRLGRFEGVKGPGFVFVTPLIESVYETVDIRVITKQIGIDAMTRDTVSIKVQAVIFYEVTSPEDASLKVDDYDEAIDLAAQTALRNAIGSSNLATVLSNRSALDEAVQNSISSMAKFWGILVRSVDINDVVLPPELANAMSQGAQAEREASARQLLAASEVVIAKQFVEAAKIYESDPVAIDLRKMNLAFEAIKSGQTNTVLIPATGFEGLASTAKAILK